MSRELELLARQFSKKPCTVLKTELNLCKTQINQVAAPFLREVAAQSKRTKVASVLLFAVLRQDQ